MRRRDFIALVGASAAAWPLAARAQLVRGRLPKITFFFSAGTQADWIQAYYDGLADYGYIPAKTIITESFIAKGLDDDEEVLARAVATHPDILITYGNPPARQWDRGLWPKDIPILYCGGIDPVGRGLVQSLSRPGGNITGAVLFGEAMVGKQAQNMKDTIPGLRRVVWMRDIQNISPNVQAAIIKGFADSNLELIIIDFDENRDVVSQFDRVVAAAPGAIYDQLSLYFGINKDIVCDLQIKYKIPVFWPSNNAPRALVGYGPNIVKESRKIGQFVDLVLKGKSPAEIPLEQPTLFDFAINTTTAKAIGITFSQVILAQATIVNTV